DVGEVRVRRTFRQVRQQAPRTLHPRTAERHVAPGVPEHAELQRVHRRLLGAPRIAQTVERRLGGSERLRHEAQQPRGAGEEDEVIDLQGTGLASTAELIVRARPVAFGEGAPADVHQLRAVEHAPEYDGGAARYQAMSLRGRTTMASE